MNKKQIKDLLIILNSTYRSGILFKYPIGNEELFNKIKDLEIQRRIKYCDIHGKWIFLK